jgi:N-methylhydantoinase B
MAHELDSVLIEVINNELGAVTEEMAVIMWKTGRSPILKSGDLATAICDSKGRIIGQGFAAPFQLAALGDLMEHVFNRFESDFSEGDVIITNDPYAGMTHMPDLGVVVPVIDGGKVVAFCLAYSHHSDVGGRFEGSSSSQCRSTYEEGLRIPLLKLMHKNERNEVILEMVSANVRFPEEWTGDLEAKVAGCQRGAEQVKQIVRKHGAERFAAACELAIDHAERGMRTAIRRAPDGMYRAEQHLADNGVDSESGIRLCLALEIKGEEIFIDFEGSSPQVAGALNTPFTLAKAAVYGGVQAIIGHDLSTNHGLFRPIHIKAPLGSVVNPLFPAAVAGRAPIFFRLFELVNDALAQALPDQVPVTGEGGDLLHFTGKGAGGEDQFGFLDIFFGGWGARTGKDGIDGVAPVQMGSNGCVSTELLEAQYPVLFDGFGFVSDSEGAGQYRGATAVFRSWRFLTPGRVMVRSVRLGPSAGLQNGQPGRASQTIFRRAGVTKELAAQTHVHFDVQPGDQIYHCTAGAGGWGNPHLRDPVSVQKDWTLGLVSSERARTAYGVALTAAGEVDWGKTKQHRSQNS